MPTEAQWEYACRAGTTESTYAGEMKIVGDNNAPILDSIAWYGGNSGVGFDLDDGWDSSDWPKKQFDHKKAGSRKVAQKQPNDWGLYDMLGNVWECCRDGERKYSNEPVTDPLEPIEKSAGRVIRGGGWFLHAQYLRAAYRGAYDPGSRYYDLGFRCVCPVAE